MSQELPIPRQDNRSDDPAVVKWGAAEPSSPNRFGRSLSGLGRDHRLPTVLAGLGAIAALASLFGEWFVMTVPNGSGPEGENTLRIPGGAADVGGFGIGYLLGLLGLVCLTALTLRGTSAARPNARLAGLALAVALPVLLAATSAALGKSGERTFYYTSAEGFQVEYGRGLVTAFLTCVLFGAALYLAGRVDTAPPGEDDGTDDNGGAGGNGGDDPEPGSASGGRGRRNRPRRHDRDDHRPPAPADLTVEPTVPFARPESPR